MFKNQLKIWNLFGQSRTGAKVLINSMREIMRLTEYLTKELCNTLLKILYLIISSEISFFYAVLSESYEDIDNSIEGFLLNRNKEY